jgi:putative ABC transport system permease protein
MDISWYGLILAALLLLIPYAIFRHLRLPLTRQMLISFTRMILQLALIGLVLQFIFKQVNLWLTLGWMLIMISNAVWTIRGRLKLDKAILIRILPMASAPPH